MKLGTPLFKQPLFWASVFFIVWRIDYILFAHPYFQFIYPDEELYRGFFATHLLNGLQMPLLEYRADNFAGGFFPIGFLGALYFKAFGDSLFVLKLVPLTISFFGFFFWILVLKKYFSEKAALFYSLMVIFAPIAFVLHSIQPIGDHTDSILFTSVSMFLFFKIIYDGQKKSYLYFLLGLIGGFSFWYAYIYAATILTILLFWTLHDRFFWASPKFLFLIIGFAVGFSPWILINAQIGFLGFNLRETPITSFFSISNLAPEFSALKRPAPYLMFTAFAPHHLDGIVRKLVILGYFFAIMLPIMILLIKTVEIRKLNAFMRKPIFFLILFLCVITLCYQLSSLLFLRYLIPSQPFLFALAAIALAFLDSLSEKKFRFASRLFCIFLVCLGLFSQISTFAPVYAGAALKMPGHAAVRIPYKDDCIKLETCLMQYKALKSTLSQEELNRVVAVFGYEIVQDRIHFPINPKEISNLTEVLPEEMLRPFYYALGGGILRYEQDIFKSIAVASRIELRDSKNRQLIQMGIVDEFGYLTYFDVDLKEALNIGEKLPNHLKVHYWRAVGRQIAEKEFERGVSYLGLLRAGVVGRVPPLFQENFIRGVGMALYDIGMSSMKGFKSVFQDLEALTSKDYNPIIKGIGMGYSYNQYLLHDLVWVRCELFKSSRSEDHALLREGSVYLEKSVMNL